MCTYMHEKKKKNPSRLKTGQLYSKKKERKKNKKIKYTIQLLNSRCSV